MEGILKAYNFWARGGVEPPLGELLSDPILILLMNRDGVTQVDVEEAIGKARQRLSEHQHATAECSLNQLL